MAQECPVVELRQYTTHPGTRDTLTRVFEQHLIEDQERCGMRVLGQFRDLGDPDRFVWLRGFANMEARTRALVGSYMGRSETSAAQRAPATSTSHAPAASQSGVTGSSFPSTMERPTADPSVQP